MTLHIIHSNKIERLHDELCYLLKNKPLDNPFESETIVCPSKAMARWVHIRFAQQMGIAAHYDYPMPSSWVWQLAGQYLDQVPEHDPLQKDVLAWRLFHHLEAIQEYDNKDIYNPILNYLGNDDNETKRWSLAKKIAFVFERYQHFRPDLIKQWSDVNTLHDEWQSVLWQTVTKDLTTDRVQLLEQLGLFLSQQVKHKNTPQRVVFFSISSLPPLLFKNIQALAKHTEVYFFILSPSEHYWSDLITLKQQAKQRLNKPELNDYFTTGHELLASWGRQGQVFQDMLLYEMDDSVTQQYDLYDDEFSPSLLNQLQRSLFELNDEEIMIHADDSIQFNLCHSALRECEVLHDQCLSLLENDGITPEDILVIVPDIEHYAEMIEAVFKKSLDQNNVKPFIPWNLSDSSLNSENPLIQIFLNVLTLPSSRFSVTDILNFLDCPEIIQRFKLLDSDKPVIREYIQNAHIHWGIDAHHKSDFDVPEMLQNTWSQAQQRFFSSYAIDEHVEYEGIAPLAGFSSSRASVISKFMLLLDRLNHWRKKLNYARSSMQWQVDLNTAIDDLFLTSDDAVIQMIRDAIDELVTQSNNEDAFKETELKRELIAQWLKDYFSNNQSNQRFFSGGVTFCGMRPMRSVPFKVIAMLGMNEHEFPRHNNPIEFDLMASQWRPGDLLISDEGRYLFLEAILCVRETLIISYCANSLKDNSQKDPSHLVSELCDYLDVHFKSEQPDNIKMSQHLSTQYAMHSFSPQNYSKQYRSYNKFWCHFAEQLQSGSSDENDTDLLSKANEAHELESSIQLKRLITCLKDPIKYYFNTQLNIRLYDEQDIDDDEPFELDALQKWGLKERLIKAFLDHNENNAIAAIDTTLLPHGVHAKASLNEMEEGLEEQFEAVSAYISQSPKTIHLDIRLNENTGLIGQLDNYYPGLGQLLITASNFGSKSFISCWLNHCALCVLDVLKPNESSLLSCKDKLLLMKPLSKSLAQQYLLEAIQIMQQASSEPLTVLPKASFFYQYFLLIKDEDKAHKEALLKWHGNPQNEASLGEKENDFYTLVFNEFYDDPDELFGSEPFKVMALKVYGQAFKYCEFDVSIS